MQIFIGIVALVLSLTSTQGFPIEKRWLQDFRTLTCNKDLQLPTIEAKDTATALGCYAKSLDTVYFNCSADLREKDQNIIEKMEEILTEMKEKLSTEPASESCTGKEKSMQSFEIFRGKLLDLVTRVNEVHST